MQKDAERQPLVILCGGSGTHHFGSMLSASFAPVTFIVNAFDDGKSTGEIRRHLGCLGPSDPAKLVTMLTSSCPVPEIYHFMKRRLPAEGAPQALRQLLFSYLKDAKLPDALYKELHLCLSSFLEAIDDQKRLHGHCFSFRDLAIRNAILVGASYRFGGYQKALDWLRSLFSLQAEIVLASDQPGFLVAVLKNGSILLTEEAINQHNRPDIYKLLLLQQIPLEEHLEALLQNTDPVLISRELERYWGMQPLPTERAIERMQQAHSLLYAPGTLYSSILPTILLLNKYIMVLKGPRVLIANLQSEHISLYETLQAIYQVGLNYQAELPITRSGMSKFVTHVLIDSSLGMDSLNENTQNLVYIYAQELENKDIKNVHSSHLLIKALKEIEGFI